MLLPRRQQYFLPFFPKEEFLLKRNNVLKSLSNSINLHVNFQYYVHYFLRVIDVVYFSPVMVVKHWDLTDSLKIKHKETRRISFNLNKADKCQEDHTSWHAKHQHDCLELHAFLVTSSISLCCIHKLIRKWEICQPLSEKA